MAKSIQEVTPEEKKSAMIRFRRKMWRHKMHTLKRKEYQRLRNMVPCIAAKPNISKVTVVEEAVKYIDQLHAALFTKLRARTSTDDVEFDTIRFGENYPKTYASHLILRHLMTTTSVLYHSQVNDVLSPAKNCENASTNSESVQMPNFFFL